ncbi:MAG: HEPN domain-containing protein [Fibromonadales bacterium]|nr:HEPN domain-containing protein [Fibromonadales bacterium]
MQNNKIKKNPWIFFADKSLKAAEHLITDVELTGEVVFCCQQSVEKFLKAYLFDLKIPFEKTHDLIKLYDKIKKNKDLKINETLLENLSDLYIESRYPTDIALLEGEVLPSVDDAKSYLEFAQNIAKLVLTEIQPEQQADS